MDNIIALFEPMGNDGFSELSRSRNHLLDEIEAIKKRTGFTTDGEIIEKVQSLEALVEFLDKLFMAAGGDGHYEEHWR